MASLLVTGWQWSHWEDVAPWTGCLSITTPVWVWFTGVGGKLHTLQSLVLTGYVGHGSFTAVSHSEEWHPG